MGQINKKILILRFSSLGDVIMANFSVMKIKKKHPDWEITWLVDSYYGSIVKPQPWVDEVIEWNRKKDGNTGFLKVLHDVRRRHFDILIDFHNSDRSSFFSLFSGVPLRYRSRRRFPLTHNRDSFNGLWDPGMTVNACRNYLSPPETSDRIRGIIGKKTGSRSLSLAIGASYEKKRWPVSCWTKFCAIAAEAGFVMYLLGDGEDEINNAKEISSTLGSQRVVNLVGQLSMPELIQVINETDATVSGDTGPVHIARALGKPLVAMFGPSAVSNRNYVESLGNVFYCSCPKQGCLDFSCSKPCMETIPPDKIVNCIYKIFQRGSSGSAGYVSCLNC